MSLYDVVIVFTCLAVFGVLGLIGQWLLDKWEGR